MPRTEKIQVRRRLEKATVVKNDENEKNDDSSSEIKMKSSGHSSDSSLDASKQGQTMSSVHPGFNSPHGIVAFVARTDRQRHHESSILFSARDVQIASYELPIHERRLEY